ISSSPATRLGQRTRRCWSSAQAKPGWRYKPPMRRPLTTIRLAPKRRPWTKSRSEGCWDDRITLSVRRKRLRGRLWAAPEVGPVPQGKVRQPRRAPQGGEEQAEDHRRQDRRRPETGARAHRRDPRGGWARNLVDP